MNKITLIRKAIASEDYKQALIDVVAYLAKDGNGTGGLAEIATELQKDNE